MHKMEEAHDTQFSLSSTLHPMISTSFIFIEREIRKIIFKKKVCESSKVKKKFN